MNEKRKGKKRRSMTKLLEWIAIMIFNCSNRSPIVYMTQCGLYSKRMTISPFLYENKVNQTHEVCSNSRKVVIKWLHLIVALHVSFCITWSLTHCYSIEWMPMSLSKYDRLTLNWMGLFRRSCLIDVTLPSKFEQKTIFFAKDFVGKAVNKK